MVSTTVAAPYTDHTSFDKRRDWGSRLGAFPRIFFKKVATDSAIPFTNFIGTHVTPFTTCNAFRATKLKLQTA